MKQVVEIRKWKRLLAMALAIVLAMSSYQVAFAVTDAHKNSEATDRELRNSDLSKEAALEGMVLLTNENNTLPLAKNSQIALFGAGAFATIKGGTGSGDVNQREIINIYNGLANAGFTYANSDYLEEVDDIYQQVKAASSTNGIPGASTWFTAASGGFGSGVNIAPKDVALDEDYVDGIKQGANTAVYVVSRVSGEGTDRANAKGDYLLSDIDSNNLKMLRRLFGKLVVILNVGGVIDTKVFRETETYPDALVLMSNAGQRGGDALADILDGDANPSGKLVDSWAENYSDYTFADTFASADGNSTREDYTEGIYVGYRFFDTFNKPVAYPFGFGLSYTSFDISSEAVLSEDQNEVVVTAAVKNTGDRAGKEVVQIYYSAPDGELEKPYQELATYAKTDLLQPGHKQTLTIRFKTANMASYSEAKSGYVMEPGDYLIRVGNSSRNTEVTAKVNLASEKKTEDLTNHFPMDWEMEEISKSGVTPYSYAGEADEITAAPVLTLDPANIETIVNNDTANEDVNVYVSDTTEKNYVRSAVEEGGVYTVTDGAQADINIGGFSGNSSILPYQVSRYKETVKTFSGDYSNSTLVDVANGDISIEQFVSGLTLSQMGTNLVQGGSTNGVESAIQLQAQGAAGHTYGGFADSKKIPNMALVDGPAGVRITQKYTSTASQPGETGSTYYQFCTAFPCGTMLAQTFNEDLLEDIGRAIGEEMLEYNATLWLAPGMNIHRSPLCGRNFEYFSEDPIVTGISGTAMTLGVQANPGVGVTIKHYALNNQETSRMQQNNTVSERAIREIYLKGYEMAVRQARPMAIMASYNANNSKAAGDDYGLMTALPRKEWGFDGFIMTDWTRGTLTIKYALHGGCNLMMPSGVLAVTEFNAPTASFTTTGNNAGNITVARYKVHPEGNETATSGDIAAGVALSSTAIGHVENGAAYVEELTGTDTWAVLDDAADTTNIRRITYRLFDDRISLGDVQQSVIDILKVAMASHQFEKLTGIEVGSYTENRSDVLETLTKNSKSEAALDIGVSLNKSTLSMEEGDTELLFATLNPADTEGTITWESSVPEIATVSADGLVTAVSTGTAVVTATHTNGSYASCTVTVTKRATEKGALQKFIDEAEKQTQSEDYKLVIKSVRDALETALIEAKRINADPNASQEEINEITRELMKWIHSLGMKEGNKNLLSLGIDMADVIDLSDYVAQGQARFKRALETAKEVQENQLISQEEIDEATDELYAAMLALRYKADTKILSSLLQQARILSTKTNIYKAESLNSLTAAIKAAESVLNADLPREDQSAVDEAFQNLLDAINKLALHDNSCDCKPTIITPPVTNPSPTTPVAVKKKVLAKAKGLKLTTKKASWKNVKNNSGYTLKLKQGKKVVKTVQLKKNKTSYRIPKKLIKKGKKYSFTLVTKGTGNYQKSKAAKSKTISVKK